MDRGECGGILIDADVTIDFLSFDDWLFRLVADGIGPVYASSLLTEEVRAIDAEMCGSFGIILCEPDTALVDRAVVRRGPLSPYDWIYLAIACEHGWTCVTNDQALRWECLRAGLPVVWGVELLCILVERHCMTTAELTDAVLRIRKTNPRITDTVVENAFRRCGIPWGE